MKYILLFILFALIGINLLAKDCEINGQDFYSYSASIDRDISYEFLKDGQVLIENDLNHLEVFSCEEAVRKKKTLMIALAPVEYGISVKLTSSQYVEEIRDSGCEISNNPFKSNQNFKEKLMLNRKKLSFIEKCVDIHVEHSGLRSLKYNLNQKNCKIKVLSDSKVVAQGGACQFDIFKDSLFRISYSIKDQCRSPKYLKSINLGPREIIAESIIYAVENANTSDMDKVLLDSKLIRFNIEPSKILGDISVDLEGRGLPVYFADYYLPDVHLGQINLQYRFNKAFMDIPLWVNNRCQKFCSGEFCSSPCNYSVSLVGLYALYEVDKSGNKKFLNEWYDGSAVPANFQGMIPFRGKRIEEFSEVKKDSQFVIEISYSDPRYEYMMLKKKMKGKLAPIPGIPIGDFYSAVNSGIYDVSSVVSVAHIPTFRTIEEFTGRNNIGRLGGFSTMSRQTYWPADFNRICNGEGSKCVPISSKPFLKFNVSFSINNQKIENLKIQRESKVLRDYIKTQEDAPSISCN
jgi:hypothetical protein